ncbi:MAG: element excision factor XisH family protein [Saprospiraceae bacterium]
MAKDLIHNAVKEALINDGWAVTRDPLTVALLEDDTYFDIDLSAERNIAGQEKIAAIEIKSFTGFSIIHAFHEALGQYLNLPGCVGRAGDEFRTLFGGFRIWLGKAF